MTLLRKLLGLSALLLAASTSIAANQTIQVVAAENFYGDLAQQLGGTHVQVSSIMSNPEQDPHLFEASPSTARALSQARLVIYNGVDYDPWMNKLLAAGKNAQRKVVVAGSLLGKKSGDNPHLWYDPATMPALARTISTQLQQLDPAHAADYKQHLAQVLTSLKQIDQRIAAMKTRHAGKAVTATEPVFSYMAGALGLIMRNERFQLAVMNGTEPRAGDIAAFERDLKTRQVRVLLYNNQASDASAKRMQQLALKAGVPVVGISETMPAGKHYQDWILSELDTLDKALK
ncbi:MULTISPECIES: metal ABC transporter solute-binding protein [unclassified Paludibacterium]|uniref:metal ABC transporter solute-binding protein n=1 Tax=unclassified Paludibacterium TaxID=2618429 RepID=UPI001C054318|nr:metal ABC transporter solute-binding protein [Paludibacterium sp. B53371]BEV70577.1 metal ABC transporter solute-binding protein [Paludibacterium sp. THUN1379]